jgi:hypothetical protein
MLANIADFAVKCKIKEKIVWQFSQINRVSVMVIKSSFSKPLPPGSCRQYRKLKAKKYYETIRF